MNVSVAVVISFKGKTYCVNSLFSESGLIVYANGRRLCSNWFRHGSTTVSYPQYSLNFLREHCLHGCREQSFAICAYAMSAVGIDVVSVLKLLAYRVVSTVSTDIVSSHAKYC